MKKIASAVVAVALLSVVLTACGDDEECESARPTGAVPMSLTDGKGGGKGSSKGSRSRSGSSKPKGSSKTKKPKIHVDVDDCDDD